MDAQEILLGQLRAYILQYDTRHGADTVLTIYLYVPLHSLYIKDAAQGYIYCIVFLLYHQTAIVLTRSGSSLYTPHSLGKSGLKT